MCSWRPVKLGVIASLARSGDNITGVSFLINELAAKKRPRAASCWSRPSLSVQSSCSASTGQKAASCSNAIFMDGSFACGARFLASARNRLPAHGAASEVMARGFRQSRLLWHGYPPPAPCTSIAVASLPRAAAIAQSTQNTTTWSPSVNADS